MMRALRWGLGVTLGLALLTVGGLLALHAALERGVFTSRINAALEQAAGRSVALGPITMPLSLRPRLSAQGATIGSIAGTTHAEFARIGRLDLTLALRPLLAGRIEIGELALIDADLVLERDEDGLPNWVFRSAATPDPAAPREPGRVTIDRLRVERSRVTLPDAAAETLDVEELTLRRLQAPGNLVLQGRVTLRGERVTLEAQLGHFTAAIAAFHARVTGEGFRLTAEGSIARRFGEPGWSLALQADVTSPARLMQLLRNDATLPPLGPLQGSAKLGPGAVLTEMAVNSGAADLGSLLGGLRLTGATLSAAGLDQPMTLTAQGSRGGANAALTLALSAPRRVFTAAAGALQPVTASLSVGPARVTARGSFTWANMFGAAPFDVTVAAPDLAMLGPVLGVDLPSLRGVQAQARVAGAGAGTLRLTGAHLTAEPVQASGDVTFAWSPRPALRGRVAATRLDLDALSPAGASHAPAPGRLIPDMPLPVEALRAMDATLEVSAESVRAGGLPWRAVRADVALQAGRLDLRSFSGTTPGGPVSGHGTADATVTPPALTLVLRSEGRGLDFAAIRHALGKRTGMEGPIEVALDLRGRGASLRPLAASLSGEAGFAMVEGRLSRSGMLEIGPNLTRILLPGGAPQEGLEIRCLALRLNAEDGLARSEALRLETSGGTIDGTAALNFRDETLAAHLRPDIRVLGVTMRAPVGIGGSFAAPSFGVDPANALALVMTDAVANRLWRSSTLEWLRGESGSRNTDCASQLRLARLGRAGREPPSAAQVIPLVPRELQAPVQDVLRGLGGILGGGRR